MTHKVTICETSALMPSLRCYVIHPCGVCARKNQNVKRMTVLLVCVSNCVRDVAVLLNLPLNSVGANALSGVAIGTINNTLTTGVRT